MKRTILSTLSVLAAAALGLLPVQTFAAAKTAAAETKAEKGEAKDASGKPLPFTGKVTKVDAAGKTFSLNGSKGDRVFVIDDATKITKENKPATLADLTVGEEARGSYLKSGDAQTVKSLMIGAKATVQPTKDGSNDPAAKPGTAPVKASGTGTSGALSPATSDTKTGAGAPNSTSSGPGVKGVPKSGGEAPAGAKKN